MVVNKRGSDTWEGGFVRHTAAGKAAYVICRRIDGTLFDVSTRCTTRRAAIADLSRIRGDDRGEILSLRPVQNSGGRHREGRGVGNPSTRADQAHCSFRPRIVSEDALGASELRALLAPC